MLSTLRAIVNLLIAVLLLVGFHAMEWLTLKQNGDKINLLEPTWPTFGVILLVACLVVVADWIVNFVFALGACLTMGFMFVAFPLIGWATLKLTAVFLPDILLLHGFWTTFLCGSLLLILRIPSTKSNQQQEVS